MIRYFLYLMCGGVLLLIGLAATQPLIIAGDRQVAVWGIAGFLTIVWLLLGFFFGVWFEVLGLFKGPPVKAETAWEANLQSLESPDWQAAAELHGPLPDDVQALYRSQRRLATAVTFQPTDDCDENLAVERFLSVDAADGHGVMQGLIHGLGEGRWLALAEDGFGNVYIGRLDASRNGRTPLYFLDHEVGVPSDLDLSVGDLLRLPMVKTE